MRRFAGLLLAALTLLPLAAQAQTFPSKPITLVVPFGPGSGTDTVARLVGQHLSAALGQSVVVENKAGANGVLAAQYVARATPDGYTLLVATNTTHSANPAGMIKNVPYDAVKDFTPVGRIGNYIFALVVTPDIPAKTLAEFIAYAKANPGKVNFGSAGAGTASHITGEYFARAAGIALVHIPYKGTGPALTDLLGGHIPMAFAPVPASHSNVAAGKLRALAVTSTARSGLLPDVPTIAESGIAGFDASLFYGLAAPAGTPRPIIDKLNKALRDALAAEEVKRQLGNDGTEIMPGSPEDYAALIDEDEKKWAQLVKASGVEPE